MFNCSGYLLFSFQQQQFISTTHNFYMDLLRGVSRMVKEKKCW